MINLVSLSFVKAQTNLFHYSTLNLFLTCSSFLSSLTVFIKIFLIQKSKSSTNLNYKEGKEDETTIDSSRKISDSWGKIYRM